MGEKAAPESLGGERWAEKLIAHCPQLLFVADPQGTLRHGSEALREALGPVAERAETLAALAHPDDRGTLAAAWSEVVSTAGPVVFGVRLRDALGAYRPLSCHVRRSPEDGWIYGAFQDDARPDPGELRALRLKEVALDCLIEHASVSTFITDRDGVWIQYGSKETKREGLDPSQILGRSIFEVYAGHPHLDRARRALAGEPFHERDEARGKYFEYWMIPRRDARGDGDGMVGLSIDVTSIRSVESELRARLEEIEAQRAVIRTLSTPIIEVWEGVLTLPMVGVVDSVRTAETMDSLLRRIVDTQARFAILDLTGVEVVDTAVANHLIELINAIKLLGAEGIVAGIKPNVAQTMVALGLDLSTLNTRRNLRAALGYAIRSMSGDAPRGPGKGEAGAGARAAGGGAKAR